MRSKHNIIVQPLPRGIELEKIYADFLSYLYRHTQSFFQDRELNGSDIWERLRGSIEFVIAHPNGWGAHEQTFLRKAVVKAGLVPAAQAQDRVRVVSEGEASVHFVMVHGDFETRLKVSFWHPVRYRANLIPTRPDSLAWRQLRYLRRRWVYSRHYLIYCGSSGLELL
jgi:hypothetical protein